MNEPFSIHQPNALARPASALGYRLPEFPCLSSTARINKVSQ